MQREIKKQQKDYLALCWQCGKSGDKLCSKCKGIGRTVLYCSRYELKLTLSQRRLKSCRECQKTDWKAGIPRPHKVICGKPFTVEVDEDKPSEASRSRDKIPPPDLAFMRPLALLHQINLLEDPSNCDYVVKSFSLQISGELTYPECLKLMFPGQQPDVGTVLPSECHHW
jgi:hypothetical protein